MKRAASEARRLTLERMVEQMAHDQSDWRQWSHLPMELWPDFALRDFILGTGFEERLCWREPTAAALREIIFEVTGCVVVAAGAGEEDE